MELTANVFTLDTTLLALVINGLVLSSSAAILWTNTQDYRHVSVENKVAGDKYNMQKLVKIGLLSVSVCS